MLLNQNWMPFSPAGVERKNQKFLRWPGSGVDKEAMKFVLASSILLFLALSGICASEPEFGIEALSSDDILLFSCITRQPGSGEFNTLFSADLTEGDTLATLTHFPERIRYYPSLGELEIQNRYGLYRLPVSGETAVRRMDIYPSFDRGGEIASGRTLPPATSPDGRWVIIQEPETLVRGALVLYDTYTGVSLVFSRDQVLDYRSAPAMWSPDSRYLLYERDGIIYYVSMRHAAENNLPDESYRQFGKGTLANLKWTGPDSLFFINGSVVSRIRPSEFFTGAFYQDPLPIGGTTGILPIAFDPHFDRFWPAPDGSSVILFTGGRNLFLFPLAAGADSEASSLPFLLLPGDTEVSQVWWRNSGNVLILTENSSRQDGAKLYSLDSFSGRDASFGPVGPELTLRFAPSPDRTLVALVEPDSISIRDPVSLAALNELDWDSPRDIFWLDDSRLLVAGSSRIEIVDIRNGDRDFLTLSSAEEAGFNSDGRIVVRSSGRSYLLDSDSIWQETRSPGEDTMMSRRTESSIHRVYTEESETLYSNLIGVRTVEGFGNRLLFPGPGIATPDLPVDVPVDPVAEEGVFSHGSRTQGRSVALVFNAIDGDKGLDDVLSVLSDYNLKTTFFVSGDFIRRHPDSTRLLAGTQHEIGSLFYTHMDMADYRYRIDREFIIRGLGRNEDEFFRTTGREITTLWHAPWYVVSPAILEASEAMNYTCIGRDVDPQDWIYLDGNPARLTLYKKSAEIVEKILSDTLPGSIIPIRIGRPGERDDYLFEKLDLLINGLLKSGYEIVTVSELQENSR